MTALAIAGVAVAYMLLISAANKNRADGALPAILMITPHLLIMFGVFKARGPTYMFLAWGLVLASTAAIAVVAAEGGASHGDASGLIFVPLMLIAWAIGIAGVVPARDTGEAR